MVKAKAPGTATITATIFVKDRRYETTVRKTCTITVKEPVLKVSPTSVKLKKGKTYTLLARTVPVATATYSTSDKKIATVSNKGVIKGVKKGSCKISVKCHGITKTVKVTVQ